MFPIVDFSCAGKIRMGEGKGGHWVLIESLGM